MEAIRRIKKGRLLGFLGLAAVLLLVAGGSATADNHIKPVFNYYDLEKLQEDPSILRGFKPYFNGDNGASNDLMYGEDSFLRFGQRGELGRGQGIDFCTDGTHDLWFYVHNGTSELTNNAAGNWAKGDTAAGQPFWNDSNSALDGLSVARETTVRLDVPTEAAGSHTIVASINAQNADEIIDPVDISCDDPTKEISLTYTGASLHTPLSPPDHASLGEFGLRGEIASDAGASLGYQGGVVPSCWDFTAVIRGQLQVVVTEKTTVAEDPVTNPEDPDDLPVGDPEPEGKTDEDIPPLGGSGAPLALVALASTLGALAYRASRRY